MLMDDVIGALKELADHGVLAGLKVETEGEGAPWSVVQQVSLLASRTQLPLALKVGGCDARTDIRNAMQLGVAEIVAPMVETEFAVAKFQQALEDISDQVECIRSRVLIESVTGVANARRITERAAAFAQGIGVGRSDLAASLGVECAAVVEQDSKEVLMRVMTVLQLAHERGLETTLGGRVTEASVREILRVLPECLHPTQVETRRMVLRWNYVALDPAIMVEVLRAEMAITRLLMSVPVQEAARWSKYLAELENRLRPRAEGPLFP